MVFHASDRGNDKGLTSTLIRYPSPPLRDDDEVLQFLTKDRGMETKDRRRFQPRHTPPDVCAAQDVALNIASSRNLTIRPPPLRADSVAPAEKKKKKHYLPVTKKDDDFAVKAPSLPPPPPMMHPSPPSSRSLAARAASPKRPFSSISTSTAPPEVQTVETAPPPPRRERTGKGRIGPVRASELANLAVNAEGLDPIRQEPRVRMEYLSKGKWYEVTGGRPSWAEDERERVVAIGSHSTRRTRASPGKYAQ